MRKTIFISASIFIASAVIFTACKTKINEEDKTETVNTKTIIERVKTIDSTVQEVTTSTTAEKTIEANTDKKDSTKSKIKDAIIKIPLTVNVTNLASKTGTIVIGVYGTKNKFLDEKDEIKEYRFKPKNGKLSVKITDLAFGELGMAIYQDVDGDGKITKNLIGIPKEPYAFSNNYKPTIKAPTFDDCKFKYSAKTNTVNMTLIH